ncbi:MAG: dihydropteroate synthase [Nitrospinae bacterium]|nr:dihydropteroate synthase [Nitrospinota bacterium]
MSGATLKHGSALIAGVLNVTPDSFSDGGDFSTPKKALARALKMEQDGADIIDVGGESSRPGAKAIPVKTEIWRVLPVIEAIRKKSRVPISIDTKNPLTARTAILAGADMINDITGFTNPALVKVAAKYNVPVVVMHMRGTPKTMQNKPRYRDVVKEVAGYLASRAKFLRKNGVEKIIIDPGIGFGKTLAHNLAIFIGLEHIVKLGFPVMIGASRKRFIKDVTGADVNHRLGGSISAHVYCALKGAAIIRVHDVAEHHQALKILEAIKKTGIHK